MEARRVVIVTGGGQGIGRATALRLARSGWHVAIAEEDNEAGPAALEELEGEGSAEWLQLDVADEAGYREVIEQVIRRHGRLDALVSNAAVAANGPLSQMALEDWNRVLAVNLTGPMLGAKLASPWLSQAEGGGVIVNIASTRAMQSEADTEAYSASKGGLVALTHALAMSLGPEVRVNCISPGWIYTGGWKKPSAEDPEEPETEDHRFHPAGRVGRPEDIAAMVEYLLSADAHFITGQNFVVDGGMTKKMIYPE